MYNNNGRNFCLLFTKDLDESGKMKNFFVFLNYLNL